MAVETQRVGDHRSEIVTVAGALTTLIALGVVFAAARDGENIMGWYANYVIPAGALLVGAVAASGYGIAAWFTGLKMTRRLVWSVVGQLLLAYFIAQYEEYRRAVPGGQIGFFAWFDFVTQQFAFADSTGKPGSPFGAWGYAMRALEIGGFVMGGWLVPAALRSKPYCDPCRTYRRSKLIALLAGGFPQDSGSQGFAEIYQAASARDRAAFQTAIAAYGPLSDKRVAQGATSRIMISAVRCPRCAAGFLGSKRFEGRGKRQQQFLLPSLPLTGEAMRTLLD